MTDERDNKHKKLTTHTFDVTFTETLKGSGDLWRKNHEQLSFFGAEIRRLSGEQQATAVSEQLSLLGELIDRAENRPDQVEYLEPEKKPRFVLRGFQGHAEVGPPKVLPPKPPSSFCLDSLVDPRVAKDWVANAEELYVERWLPQHGRKKANIIWYCQITRVVIGQWLTPVLTFIDRVWGKAKSENASD